MLDKLNKKRGKEKDLAFVNIKTNGILKDNG